VFDVRLLARRSISYHNNGGYDLTIDHLPANRRYSVERCRISASQDFTSLGTTVQSELPIRLREEFPPPGIELLTIRALDGSAGAAADDTPSGRCTAQMSAATNHTLPPVTRNLPAKTHNLRDPK
jgi:hypothetical protein